VIEVTNHHRSILFALFAIALFSCSAEETRVWMADSVLHYEGPITESANRRVEELYSLQQIAPTALSIRSQGGDIVPGMALGRWVFEHGLDVEIDELCFSSCANYVLTAGRRVRLRNTAFIGWHGGATQEMSLEDLSAIHQLSGKEVPAEDRERNLPTDSDFRDWIRKLVEQERAFFALVGVDQSITTLGQHGSYPERFSAEEGYIGWDYSLEDLISLGLDNVEVLGGPRMPKQPKGGLKLFRVQLDEVSRETPRVGPNPDYSQKAQEKRPLVCENGFRQSKNAHKQGPFHARFYSTDCFVQQRI